jgi:hypothetical protein
MGMNVAQIFRAVREGRVLTRLGYAWSCPQCGVVLAESRNKDRRDRGAVVHCLLHRASEAEAGHVGMGEQRARFWNESGRDLMLAS